MARRAQLPDNELRTFLREARSSWRVSQVIVAEDKLRRMDINTVSELLRVLKVDGHLDELCNFHGEKAFPEDTVKALVVQASKTVSAVEAAPPASMTPAPVSKTVKPEAPADAELERNRRTAANTEPEQKAQARRRLAPQPSALPVTSTESELPPQVPPASASSFAPTRESEFPAAELQQKIKEKRELCKANRVNLDWAEQMAEEELKKEYAMRQQWANWKRRKAPNNDQQANEQQLFSPAARRQSEDVEWFCVVFSKVFVKKAPDEKAKSWGFVYRGQMLEVLRRRASDSRGRDWVELTPFELWRSCLRHLDSENAAQSETGAFCLIDGADMKLGALISGPLPRSEWPVVSPDELRNFDAWACQQQRVDSSPLQETHEVHADADQQDTAAESGRAESGGTEHTKIVAQMAPKAAHQFQALRDMHIHEKADLKARILGRKVTGEVVYAEEGMKNGWVKLAGEPGWVVFDISFDESDEVQEAISQQAKLKMARGGVISKFQARDMDVAKGCRIDVQNKLRQALKDADEAPLKELHAAIIWAQAYGVNPDLILQAEQKFAELSKEGEYGRMVRQARALLLKAASEPELRSLIEHCESTDLPEVAEEARAALKKFLAEQASAQSEQAGFLERFRAAVSTGQPAEIKAVRDAARAAGVPKKELARIFALAQEEAGC